MNGGQPIIQVENLTKRFKNIVAVNDISFTVSEAEIFGFLGPNGAGKTTTINVLCTLLRPSSGQVRLAGYDVVKQQREVRQSIGLVFQDPSLDDVLTAWENLQFHAAVYNIPGALARSRMEDMLKLVELWDRRNDPVKTFSGGMKRRLEIVRGLLHYPKVLFLDEPTLGLDPQTRNRLWAFILELRKREKITIFLTTHYMDEADNADRIAIIDHGQTVALDTPENLRRMVGGDIITLKSSDDAQAIQEIKQRYNFEVAHSNEGITFEVAQGDTFIPAFISNFDTPILSISLRRPTLDDVFLKLTGRQIRDEEASAQDHMRTMMQGRGGMAH